MTRTDALNLLVEHTPYGTEDADRTTCAVSAIMAAFAIGRATPVTAVGGEPSEFHDFITHRSAWMNALRLARDAAHGADIHYWNHEIEAFDRAFDLIGQQPIHSMPDSLRVDAMWQAFCRTADYRQALKWAESAEAPGSLFVAFKHGLWAALAPIPGGPK